MKSESEAFEAGYKLAYDGKPLPFPRDCFADDFVEGYDAGECDRPTLEEVTGVDYQKDPMNDPLGY